MKELKFSDAEGYYIFPFLFDVAPIERKLGKGKTIIDLLTAPQNFKTSLKWKFEKGIPKSRKGFSPLLPYQSIFEYTVHCNFDERTDAYYPRALDKSASEKGIEVKVSKSMIINSSGVGCLTYKVCLDKSDLLAYSDLQIFPRLIPRIWDWKEDAELKKYFFSLHKENEKETEYYLHSDFYDQMGILENFFQDFVERPKKKRKENPLWECRRVLKLDEEQNFTQPYLFYVLDLPKLDGDTTVADVVKEHTNEFVALLYKYFKLDYYKKISPDLIREFLKHDSQGKLSNIFSNTGIFVHVYSTSAFIVRPKEFFLKESMTRSALSSIEHTIMRLHFAYILDVVIDDFIKNLMTVDLDKIYEQLDPILDILKQVAVFQENLNLYTEDASIGSDLNKITTKVFDYHVISQSILNKVNMLQQIFENREKFESVKSLRKSFDRIRKKNE